jgi:decaprenyl-phosphate phosphoribosyltransferase
MILLSIIKLLRPQQWAKNLLLLFPPFFAGKIFDMPVRSYMFPSLLSFCLAASCSYIVNDIIDRETDKNHHSKKNRAIARGDVSVPLAVVIAVVLYLSAMLISSSVSRRFEVFLTLYFVVSFAYTFIFKNIVIADIFFIAFGFLIRVLAGGEAFNIVISSWLFLTVFLVALLLGAGKRLGELVCLGDNAGKHRKILNQYSHTFLEGLIWFSAAAALVTYALYTLERKNALFYTVPLAAFGLIRYMYIVKQGKGDPTEALLFDKQIMGIGILWACMIGLIIYAKV